MGDVEILPVVEANIRAAARTREAALETYGDPGDSVLGDERLAHGVATVIECGIGCLPWSALTQRRPCGPRESMSVRISTQCTGTKLCRTWGHGSPRLLELQRRTHVAFRLKADTSCTLGTSKEASFRHPCSLAALRASAESQVQELSCVEKYRDEPYFKAVQAA